MPPAYPSDHTPATDAPVPSVLDGAPLPRPDADNLVTVLNRAAERTDGPKLWHLDADGAETGLSYAELRTQAARVLAGLRAAGLRTGEPVMLHLGDGMDLVTAFWGCVLGGFVPVQVPAELPAADASGTGPLARLWLALGQPVVLSDRDPAGYWADPALRPRWLGPVAGLCGHAPDTDWAAPGWDDLALLTLTAGSTGTPKAVRLSHGTILSRCAGTVTANALDTATTSVNWMPLHHVSGLVMFHLRDVYAGATQVHASRRWVLDDPLRWLDLIDRYRAQVTWGPNSAFDLLLDRLAQAGGRRWDLSCLRYVMNGGQPVQAATVRRALAELARFGLPPTAIRPGWGMSETASGVVDHHVVPADLATSDILLPVGRPQPGVRVRVVDESDRVVPVGTLGHLQVTGDPVTDGYQWAPEGGWHPFTADGWLRTGDVAYVRDGTLTVTGNTGSLLRIGGRNRPAHEIEAVVARLPFVVENSPVACGVGVDGDQLAIFCALRPDMDAPTAVELIRRAVSEHWGVACGYVVPMEAGAIPRTATGKPKRGELIRLLADASATPATPAAAG